MYVKPNVTKTLLTQDHDTDERDVDRINRQKVVEKGMERRIIGWESHIYIHARAVTGHCRGSE